MMPEEDFLKVPDPDNKKKKFEKEQVMLSEKFYTGDLVEYYYYDSEHLTHHFGIIVSPIELYYAEDDEEEIYANGNYVNIQKFDIYGNINWNSEPKKLYLSGKECYVVKPVSAEYMNDYLKNQFNDDIAHYKKHIRMYQGYIRKDQRAIRLLSKNIDAALTKFNNPQLNQTDIL